MEMASIFTGGLTVQGGWSDLTAGGHLALSLRSSDKAVDDGRLRSRVRSLAAPPRKSR